MKYNITAKEQGYCVRPYGMPVKRYCQTLDLKDNPKLIAEYRKRHQQGRTLGGNSERHPGSRYLGNGDIHPRQPTIHDCGNSVGFRLGHRHATLGNASTPS